MSTVRQSTAATVIVGPVRDSLGAAVTDGVVADFKASKNGGVPAALDGSATLTHRHTGHYSLTLAAADLNTVGTLEVLLDDGTNTCQPRVLQVVEEAVYDALYAPSAPGYVPSAPVDLVAIDGTPVAVDSQSAGVVSFTSGAYVANGDSIASLATEVGTRASQTSVNALALAVDLVPTTAETTAAVWEHPADTLTLAGTVLYVLNTINNLMPTAAENADKLLGRAIAGGADGGRTVSQALAASRNKVVRSGSTLTVYAADDTTPLWTATITTDATANPLTGIDPT